MKTKYTSNILWILLVLGMVGMGVQAPITVSGQGDTVVIGTTDSISSLDPADAYDYFSSNTIVQITHGLMEMPVDSTDAVKGPIVDSFDVSSDALTYTFNLKSDLKFSDGATLDAAAVASHFERVIDLNGDPGFLISNVLVKENITVVDTDTIEFKLSVPDATFLQRLTYTVAWPVSPNSLPADSFGGEPTSIPAGSGPYEVTSWTKGTELILEPNHEYFGEHPANDKIIIKFYADSSALLTALESGEIDVAHKAFGPDEITSIKANPDFEWQQKDTAGIRYLVLNVEEHTDKAVRQALSLSVDRSEITTTIFDNFNNPIFSMVPKIFPQSIDAYDDGPDQAQVATLMEGAGYVKDTTKYALDLFWTPSHYGSDEGNVAQLLETQLEATGFFDVTLQSNEWDAYLGDLGTMGLFLLGWWFDYPDPSNYIDPFVGSGAFSLGTNYSSSVMDGYIDTMLTDPDKADRDQAIKDAQTLMAEDVPLIPLFSMLDEFSAYQTYVEGYLLEPSANVHYNSIFFSAADDEGGGFLSFGIFIPALIVLISATLIVRKKKY